MCQPAGELTDRLHFLRLTQFFLGMDQLGRALGDAQLEGIVQRAQRRGGTVAFGLDGASVFHIDQYARKAQRDAFPASGRRGRWLRSSSNDRRHGGPDTDGRRLRHGQ